METFELNWSVRKGVKPVTCNCVTAVGVGPKVDCSRKRVAAASVTDWPVITCAIFDVVEVTAPGSGFATVTFTFPLCKVVAVPEAVSSVEESNTVVRAVLPNITCAPDTNFDPVTIRVNAPTPIVDGLTEDTTGIGFCKVMELDAITDELLELTAWTVALFGLGTALGAV